MNRYISVTTAISLLLLGTACSKQEDTAKSVEAAADRAMESAKMESAKIDAGNAADNVSGAAGAPMETMQDEGTTRIDNARQAGQGMMQDAEKKASEAMDAAAEMKQDVVEKLPGELKK